MQVELMDYEVADLIKSARYLLKIRNDWIAKYGDLAYYGSATHPPCPESFMPYLHVRHVIKEALKQRRARNKVINEVWTVWAEHVIESRKNKEREQGKIIMKDQE